MIQLPLSYSIHCCVKVFLWYCHNIKSPTYFMHYLVCHYYTEQYYSYNIKMSEPRWHLLKQGLDSRGTDGLWVAEWVARLCVVLPVTEVRVDFFFPSTWGHLLFLSKMLLCWQPLESEDVICSSNLEFCSYSISMPSVDTHLKLYLGILWCHKFCSWHIKFDKIFYSDTIGTRFAC